jgi:hypothetical protein
MPAGMPPGYPPPAASVAMGALFYLGIAVVFGWLGVGSILARRWARTLSLALGWIWLLSGLVGGLFSLVLLPRIFAAMPQTGGPDMTGVAMGCAIAVIVPVLILLPLAFVLFYRGRNVRATFEARDPHPRWTDRCPFPVLVLALLAAFAVLPCALNALHPAVPLFGRLLTGPPGAAAMLLFALLQVALAWGLYKLRPGFGRLATLATNWHRLPETGKRCRSLESVAAFPNPLPLSRIRCWKLASAAARLKRPSLRGNGRRFSAGVASGAFDRLEARS